MSVMLTPEQENRIAAMVAAQIQGNNGTEHKTTLALIEYKLTQLEENWKAYQESQKRKWQRVYDDHDDLTSLKSKFSTWKYISGAFQAVGTFLGIMLGKNP